MDFFHRRKGELHCEDVPLTRIARSVGTPVYIYSAATLRNNYRRLAASFRGTPVLLCYSVKANSNQTILRELRRLGAGFDIVSGGELYRVLRAGGDPKRVVFSGVGKTEEEIDYGLRRGILSFNVESPAELERLAERARRLRGIAGVIVRVNPDVDPHTHPHISTGRQVHKFGVHWQQALDVCLRAAALPNVDFLGIGCHIGSQITRLQPFERALRRLRKLGEELQKRKAPVRYLDFGGGIGIRYQQECPVPLAGYAARVGRVVRALGCRLILEPGRILIGHAGVLLTRVVLEKNMQGHRFVVVDAGMSDFLRPALYNAAHRIEPVRTPLSAGRRSRCDVVGPLCETADSLGRGLRLPQFQPGDVLAIRDTGAYGFVLSSNYNAHRRPPEVLVRGGTFRVIRRRERWEDLLRGE